MRNVFIDYHHSDLAYGLQLLFEKRLGDQCYFPIGMDWWGKNYWAINNFPETAKQYLRIEQAYQPTDGTLPLNENYKEKDGDIYYVQDKHNNTFHKAITLDTFKEIDIDIVIASIPQHIKPFKELAKMKNARFVFQAGNVFPEVIQNLHEIPNLMANTLPPNIPQTCHYIQYHQEFDTDIFNPSTLIPRKKIASFINIYQNNGGFADFMTMRTMLPNFEFKSYGAQNSDGIVNTTKEIASEMQRSMFGFHVKSMGDGFGHILYNWFACGRPIITRTSDYKGKIGEELLTHMETVIDLDSCSFEQAYDTIVNMTPHYYEYMCSQAYKRFVDLVDYRKEAEKVREFLDKLI